MEQMGPYFDVEIDALKFRCRINDNATENRMILDGAARKIRSFRRLTGDLGAGGVFVDIGANNGLFTLHAARLVGPQGMVLAIEPNPAMLDRLRYNIQVNEFGNVRVAGTAVGEKTGSALLYLNGKNHGEGSLYANPGHCISIKVSVVPLVDLLRSHDVEQVDALKIDTEGYEDRVLMPFFARAPEHLWPRRLIIETTHASRWQRDCVAYMRDVGYTIEWQGRSDVLLVRSSHA
jgi:FkbM family methyltransferase